MGEFTKVLIIDDDADFINALSLFLRKDQCEVFSAGSAGNGLDLVRTISPDIILLDVVLPDGNGFELCKIIKNDPSTANILVILCSGQKITSDSQAEGLESGADGYLLKAMSAREMQARLKIYIQNKMYEKALQLSEERFRVAQEMSPDGFTILHPLKNEKGEIVDFTWVYENQTIARINGTDPVQVIGKRLLDLFPAHKGTEVFNAYVQTAQTGKSHIFEEVYVGEIISVPTWLRLVVVPSGEDITIFSENITDRKESEEKLRLNRNMLETILNTIPQSVFWKDRNGRYLGCNSQFANAAGLQNPDDVIGKTDFDLPWPKEEAEAYRQDDQYVMDHNAPKPHIIEPLQQADGSRLWIETTKIPLSDDSGAINGMLGVYSDITERILADEELQIKNRAIESSINAIALADLSGNLTYVNASFLKLWGYQDLTEVIGRSSVDFWQNREDPSVVMESLHNQGLWQGEMTALRSDNTVFLAEVSANLIRDLQGFPLCLQASFIDVTERRRAEEALKINEMKYRTLFENSSDAILLMKGDKFIDCNLRTLEIFGCQSPDQILGHTPIEFSPAQQPNGRASREYALDIINAALNGQTQLFEWVHTKPDGTQFTAEVKLNKLEVHDQILLQSIVRDITKRKEAEEALRQAGDILHNMQMGLYVYELENQEDDHSLRLVAANPSSGKLSGVSTEDMVGKYIDDIFPALRAIDIPKRFADVVCNGKAGEFEDLYYSDDRILNAAYAVKAFPLPNHRVGVTFDNITERKQVEAAIRMSEERFKSIIAVSKTGAWEYHSDRDYLWCSTEYFTMLGLNPENFLLDGTPNLNETWLILLHPDDRERASRHFSDYLAGGSQGMYENYFRLKHQNGDWVWIWSRGQTLRDSDGNLTNRTLGTHIDITDRKLAEQELIKAKEKAEINEAKLNEAQEIAKLGSWELDIQSGIFTFTDSFYKIFHTNAEEMGGYQMTIEDYARQFVHPDDASKVANETRLAIESPDPFFSKYVEHRIFYRDGGLGYISVRFFIVKDEFGNTVKTFGVNQDITEKKIVEIELIKAKVKAEESQQKFKAIADTSPLAIYISKGIRQVAEYINPAFYKLFGYTYQEVSEVALWWPLAYPDLEYQKKVSGEWNSKVENAINNRTDIEPMEVVVTCKDGSKKNILWGFVSTGDENWAFGMDLTAYRKTELELITAKERAEESEDKIKLQNQEILFNNERLESLLRVSQLQTNSVQELLDFALSQAVDLTKSTIGYIYYYLEDKKQFILNTWSNEVMKECSVIDPQTVYDLDKTGCWGEAVRQRKPIVINDYQAENPLKKGTPEGHVKLEKFLTIPVIFDGKIVAVAGVANKTEDYNDSDIRQLTLLMDNVWKMSERLILIKDLQSAKEKAEESDRLKSAFLANMSHEIRTPMNGILGFADLLKEPNLTGEEQQRYIGIIEKSGHRMLNIINDIVDISKIEAGLMTLNITESHINEQIEYIHTFFKPEATAKGLKLSVKNSLTRTEAVLATDREKLYAVLTNLVKNAIKYTETGEIELGCTCKDTFIEFYVKDTGIGIPKERQQAVFERFVQADIEDKMARQGAGLGLAISKAYVEMMGGRIWLESEEGKGSSFFFTLPCGTITVKESAVHQTATQSANEVVRRLKLLIVEDDEVSEWLLDKTLQRLNAEILKARTGIQAVETVRNLPDIDLILMDIRLPEMGGYEATKLIRQFNTEVVIIAQTAYGLTGDKEKAIGAGCDDYLAKPLDQEKLKAMINKYFGEKPYIAK